jgi:signal transduction histidine kinase
VIPHDLTLRRPEPAATFSREFWRRLIAVADAAHRRRMIALIAGLLVVIGIVDFLLGFEISLLVFYFLPVCLAVVSLGWLAGVVTAVLSVITWLGGDFAAGAHFSNPLVPCWNALIALVIYLVVIWLFDTLLVLHREMEERVRQRTAALTDEIAERKRLELEILRITERERVRIGHDLHDGLGQHLTGTAIAAQVLSENLERGGAPAAPEARRVVQLVGQAIDQTRALAKGLLLAEIEEGRLLASFQELAAVSSSQFRIQCVFSGPDAVPLPDNTTASHLYRIAQEAVRNAVRHGKARRVEIVLAEQDAAVTLTISDNGAGLPPEAVRGRGMGLRIMAHRAATIGARLFLESPAGGGTRIVCRLPLASPLS